MYIAVFQHKSFRNICLIKIVKYIVWMDLAVCSYSEFEYLVGCPSFELRVMYTQSKAWGVSLRMTKWLWKDKRATHMPAQTNTSTSPWCDGGRLGFCVSIWLYSSDVKPCQTSDSQSLAFCSPACLESIHSVTPQSDGAHRGMLCMFVRCHIRSLKCLHNCTVFYLSIHCRQ